MSIRVLIVDDDPLARAIAFEILSGAGYTCAEAENGVVAIESLAVARPDLVVTDMCMPKADGFDTIKAVRERLPDCPIIAVSAGFPGMNPDLLLSMARQLGADAVVPKPLRQDAFLAIVGKVLGQGETTCA